MLSRRGFLGLFSKAALVVAAAQIPFVSPIAQKVAARCGWFAVTINEQRYYIPYWN